MDQIGTGKFIAACRREQGLTQAQLAERLGVSDRAVSKWETGRNMPDISIIEELCGILGITPGELLRGERETALVVRETQAAGAAGAAIAAVSERETETPPVTALAVRQEGRGFFERLFPVIRVLPEKGSRRGKRAGKDPVIDAELSPEEAQEILSGQPRPWEDCDTAFRQYGETPPADRKYNKTLAAVFTGIMLLAVIVCLIVDIAVSGRLSWSVIPVLSAAFGWLVFIPSVFWGKRGISSSLILLSIMIFPYLFSLGHILQTPDVFRIGASAAVPSLLFIWVVYGIFISQLDRCRAWGICCLLAVPFELILNFILSRVIDETILDIWDLLTVTILMFAALVLFNIPRKEKAEN